MAKKKTKKPIETLLERNMRVSKQLDAREKRLKSFRRKGVISDRIHKHKTSDFNKPHHDAEAEDKAFHAEVKKRRDARKKSEAKLKATKAANLARSKKEFNSPEFQAKIKKRAFDDAVRDRKRRRALRGSIKLAPRSEKKVQAEKDRASARRLEESRRRRKSKKK